MNPSRALRRWRRGWSSRLSPSGPASMSKTMRRAGVSAASFRMRLSAGCRRICRASKASLPVELDDQLAVEDELRRVDRGQQGDHLGKVAAERLAGFGAELDGSAGFEGEAAEAVPLRLELPGALGLGQGLGRAGFHGRGVEGEGEGGALLLASATWTRGLSPSDFPPAPRSGSEGEPRTRAPTPPHPTLSPLPGERG